MAVCADHKKPFGITVDCIGPRRYKFVWAFKIDAAKAHREGYDANAVTGSIEYNSEYPGCPYCGSKQFYVCGRCGKVVCYHGEKTVTCPDCGNTADVEIVEELNLKGGGY